MAGRDGGDGAVGARLYTRGGIEDWVEAGAIGRVLLGAYWAAGFEVEHAFFQCREARVVVDQVGLNGPGHGRRPYGSGPSGAAETEVYIIFVIRSYPVARWDGRTPDPPMKKRPGPR